MNKKIVLKKHTLIFFIINVLVLLLSLILKMVYTKLGYYSIVINAFFFINMLFLVLGIISNIFMLLNQNKFKYKKTIKVLIIYSIIYILLNTLVISLINMPISRKYNKTSSKLVKYCDSYVCDKFEVKKTNEEYNFVLEKNYLDFSNNNNKIIINNYYIKDKIVRVEARVYSDGGLFSEYLIKEQIKDWFSNFDYEVNYKLIKQAFDKRYDNTTIKSGNAIYTSKEEYGKADATGDIPTKTISIITLNIK